jgi:hypothetical protein
LTPLTYLLLENKIREFIEDNRFTLMYVNFVHVAGGKCKLNGKRIDVKMTESGDLVGMFLFVKNNQSIVNITLSIQWDHGL